MKESTKSKARTKMSNVQIPMTKLDIEYETFVGHLDLGIGIYYNDYWKTNCFLVYLLLLDLCYPKM
ncbi:MAG: hypothetical protein AB1630_03880 [bacterium]